MMKVVRTIIHSAVPLLLCGCEGILGGIYDEPLPIVHREGQVVVDAAEWTEWHYIDLNNPDTIVTRDIPMTLTGEDDGHSGLYLYLFDIFGEGITKSEYVSYTPCDPQPDPASWTLAVNRGNVRTNGGAVYETTLTSMDDLPPTSEEFHTKAFTPDEWSENEVWADNKEMFNCLVASQGIAINKVLSSWLRMDLPPIPPVFTHNHHVFILRLKDGTYAALQLENYVSPAGKNCYLTVNYKYPY